MRLNSVVLFVNKKLWTHAAQAAYEGYAESTGGKTYDGREMPKWEDLTPVIQKAWVAATRSGFELLVREAGVHGDFA